MDIRRLGPGDDDAVLAAADLFDHPPRPEWTRTFLTDPRHHLLLAVTAASATADADSADPDSADAVSAVGFVTGVELTHPDKGTEMFLYELGVHEDHRRQGVGRALVTALAGLARERGCYGMWVLTDGDNEAALGTYRAGGAGLAEATVMLSWEWPDDS